MHRPHTTTPVEFASSIKRPLERLAILEVGDRKGLWTFHAFQPDLGYLVERGGTIAWLTPDEVDRLPRDHFLNEECTTQLKA